MYILSVDSSTRFCSVAVHHDGNELFSVDNFTEKSASSALTILVQSAADATGIKLSEIDAFAVGKGPGSYTGLRVATSVVKGLCFALDKPLIGVNTLGAMALRVRKGVVAAGSRIASSDWLFAPMIDARRMEVYTAVYDLDGREVVETHPLVVESSSFDHWLEEHPVVFFGDGAPKCQSLLGDKSNAIFWNASVHPSAAAVGELASLKYQAGDFEEVVNFEPFYLKEFMGKGIG